MTTLYALMIFVIMSGAPPTAITPVLFLSKEACEDKGPAVFKLGMQALVEKGADLQFSTYKCVPIENVPLSPDALEKQVP